ELGDTIRGRVAPSSNGASVEMAGDVLRQLVWRSVATSRVLLHRFQHDRIEIPSQAAPKGVGGWTDGDRARRRGVGVAYSARNVVGSSRIDIIGPPTC